MNEKLFTLEQAQRMLPVLESLLKTAREAQQKFEELEGELQQTLTRILVLGGVQIDPVRTATQRALKDRAEQVRNDALGEIEATGVQVKDLEQGLLDFPCMLHDETVLLCWKQGEKTIAWWHGLEEGFGGRKKIDPEQFSPPSGKPN